jgi:hypothetical protein
MVKVATVAVLFTLATVGLVLLGALSPADGAVVALMGLVVVLLERTHRGAPEPVRTTHTREDRDVARTLDDLRVLGVTAGGAPSRYPALPTV